MSTESIDPELVEQTKQQIRNLVREIAQLSKSQLSPAQYYEALLTRLIDALAAVGGAIWTLAEGRLQLEYQIKLRETGAFEGTENQTRHTRLLQRVLTEGEGMLVPPQSGSLGEDEAGNPTDYLLVLGPLKTDRDTLGIIEVFQRPGAGPNVQRGYLRFLLQMCELASDFLKTRQLRHYSDRQTLWAQLENFTRVAHRSLDPIITAYTIANEGRRLIECDRVSIAIAKGRKCKIQAVSGQDVFDKRSNTVSMLGRLATAVVATGEPVWYTGDTTDMPPQVEEAVQEYVDESHSKMVGVIPLLKHVDETDEKAKKEPPQVLGALIVEQIEDATPRDGMLQRVEVVREHSAAALGNAIEYHSLFLLPVWQKLGQASFILKARTLPKTLSVAGAILALLLVLILWPADFELHSTGELLPVIRRDVFANVDGVVERVHVRNGQPVEAYRIVDGKKVGGTVLATMRNEDLKIELTGFEGERAKTEKELLSKQHMLAGREEDNRNSSPYERAQLRTDVLKLKTALEDLDARIELHKKKIDLLTVRSPIKGQVDTWEVRERLIGRPVQRGETLMRVVNPGGEWELELHMPESRMGHIAKARSDLKKEQPGKDLAVTYILATDPGAEHQGTVKEVHGTAEVKGEEGNVVLVRVAIDKKDLIKAGLDDVGRLRSGSGVTAKVYCGRAPLGYVWLHDLIAFVQSKILFKL